MNGKRLDRCPSRVATTSVCLMAAVGVSTATAGSYTFTKLADPSGAIHQIQDPGAALNADGVAAFRAVMDDETTAIIRADGVEETIIASTAQFAALDSFPDINDSGLVAFAASVTLEKTGRPGVFAGDGDTITTIGAPNKDPFGDNFGFWEMNATHVMMAKLAPNSVAEGVSVGSGGPVVHVYDGADFDGNNAMYGGDLTDAGHLTVIAGPVVGLRWAIYMGATDGRVPVCIAGLQEFNTSFQTVSANNNGELVFIATHWTEAEGYRSGVYLWTGGPTGCDDDGDEMYVTIAHENGPFWAFDTAGGPAINDATTVAFRASLDAGGHGIYTGGDPVADRVIGTGDDLDGSTVSYVSLNRFGMNNAGQIAFYAVLANGGSGIYLATPSACPADLDGSGDVGFSDILQILSAWGPCGGCPEDLDESGDVGFSDVLIVLGAWGPCK